MPFPPAAEGPPGLPRPPLPPAAGGGGAATEGLSREQWRQDSRVLPHGRHMSPTAQPPHLLLGVRASSPPAPRCLPAGPAGADTNGEGRVERSKNQHSRRPIPHCPSPFPSAKGSSTTLASHPLQSGLRWQNGYLILLFKKSEIHGPEVRQPREQGRPGPGILLGQPQTSDR